MFVHKVKSNCESTQEQQQQQQFLIMADYADNGAATLRREWQQLVKAVAAVVARKSGA
jgi:hypothetical protein